MRKGKNNAALRWLWTVSGRDKFKIFWMTVVQIVNAVAGVLFALLLRCIIDSAMALILYLLPSLACVIIPGGLLLLLLTYAFRRKLKLLHRKIQETDGALRVFLTERLSGMLIVRTFGRTEHTAREAAEKMTDHRDARMERNRFSNLCNIGYFVRDYEWV